MFTSYDIFYETPIGSQFHCLILKNIMKINSGDTRQRIDLNLSEEKQPKNELGTEGVLHEGHTSQQSLYM